MRLLRRLLATNQPQEARFFLVLSVFGLVIAVIYWFVSYEPAGTVLLAGFGVATGLISLRLLSDPASRRVRSAVRDRAGAPLPEAQGPGGGTGGVDRPFLDERGRLPDESIAPFAVGLGAALASTALIFGPAPAIIGLLPFAWGAWAWLSGAKAELDAQVEAGDVTSEPGDDGRAARSRET